jgi:beta-galactosidase
VRFQLKTKATWAPAGHEVAWEQFSLPFEAPRAHRIVRSGTGRLDVDESASRVRIAGKGFHLDFDRNDGVIRRFVWHGASVLKTGPRVNAWRAATDNDGIKRWSGQGNKPLGRWLAAGLDRLQHTVRRFSVRMPRPDVAVVSIESRAQAEGCPHGVTHRHRYVVLPTGDILIHNRFGADRGLPDLPRLGVAMTLPGGYERLSWLGRGPHENYCDRNTGAPVGLWHGTVTEQYVPYIMPQENGNKTDVRWLSVQCDEGIGLLAVGDPVFEAGVSHLSASDLFGAFHTHELTAREETCLTLDMRQRGLGNGSCGPGTLPKYRVQPGSYSFSYRLRPFSAREDPGDIARQALGSAP